MLLIFKENHGLYIEFLKEFTRFVYNNFEQNVKHIKDLSAVVSVKESNFRSAYAGIMRIEMTEKTFMTALGLLLDFFKIKLVLPDDAINKYNNIFVSSVRNCIDNTKEHVKKENKDSRTEYIDEIARMIEYSLDGFYEDCNYIAKDYKKAKSQGRACYFFVNDGYICFKGHDLENYFKNLDGFEYAVSKKAISSQLKHHGLLKIHGGECSFPCRTANNKTRYYHIYITELVNFIYTDSGDAIYKENLINKLQ